MRARIAVRDTHKVSRKRREAIDSVKTIKLMQFSLPLEDKFILEDICGRCVGAPSRRGLPGS